MQECVCIQTNTCQDGEARKGSTCINQAKTTVQAAKTNLIRKTPTEFCLIAYLSWFRKGFRDGSAVVLCWFPSRQALKGWHHFLSAGHTAFRVMWSHRSHQGSGMQTVWFSCTYGPGCCKVWECLPEPGPQYGQQCAELKRDHSKAERRMNCPKTQLTADKIKSPCLMLQTKLRGRRSSMQVDGMTSESINFFKKCEQQTLLLGHSLLISVTSMLYNQETKCATETDEK